MQISLAGKTFAVALLAVVFSQGARASELKVLSGSGVQPVMGEIIPQFERTSGNKVVFDYGTVGGMTERVQNGEIADVIIASAQQIIALEKQNKVVPVSHVTYPALHALQRRRHRQQ